MHVHVESLSHVRLVHVIGSVASGDGGTVRRAVEEVASSLRSPLVLSFAECASVERTEVEPLVSGLRRFAGRLRIVSPAGTLTRAAFERIDVAAYDDFRAALRDLGRPRVSN